MVVALWEERSDVGVGRTKAAHGMLALDLWWTSRNWTLDGHSELMRRWCAVLVFSSQTNEMTELGLDVQRISKADLAQ